jgi:hypothetical protein
VLVVVRVAAWPVMMVVIVMMVVVVRMAVTMMIVCVVVAVGMRMRRRCRWGVQLNARTLSHLNAHKAGG